MTSPYKSSDSNGPEYAGTILRGPTGEVLLLKKPAREGERWDLPKGRVEPNESIAGAAARETYEETGIRPVFDGNFVQKDHNGPLTFWLLSATVPTTTLALAPTEHDTYRWVSPHQAATLLDFPLNRMMLRYANNDRPWRPFSNFLHQPSVCEGRGHRPGRERKKPRGPKWVRPSTSAEKHEIHARAADLGVHPEKLTRAIERGKLRSVGKKGRSSLANTDVGEVKSKKAFHQMGRDYGKDTARVASGMKKSKLSGAKRTKMPAPMIVRTKKRPKGYLVGGNTRSVGADVHKRHFKAVVADLRNEDREISPDGTISCGVFLPIPYHLARLFPDKSHEDDSVPHFTLLFVGPLTAEQFYNSLVPAAQQVARRLKPFTVEMRGYNEFKNQKGQTIANMHATATLRFVNPVIHGAMHGLAGLFDSPPGLPMLHTMLWNEAKARGIEPAHSYGGKGKGKPSEALFKAHATLQYLDPGESYDGPKPEGTWVATELQVWGHERICCPLGRLLPDQPRGGSYPFPATEINPVNPAPFKESTTSLVKQTKHPTPMGTGPSNMDIGIEGSLPYHEFLKKLTRRRAAIGEGHAPKDKKVGERRWLKPRTPGSQKVGWVGRSAVERHKGRSEWTPERIKGGAKRDEPRPWRPERPKPPKEPARPSIEDLGLTREPLLAHHKPG